jgi:hypothetical protein
VATSTKMAPCCPLSQANSKTNAHSTNIHVAKLVPVQ